MSKPNQTTIHPDDVEIIVRDFDKKPEPNPYMVEAHRKAREAFSDPMNKPSDAAIRTAKKLTYVGCFHHNHYVGDEQAAATIDAHTAKALSEHKRVLDECEIALKEVDIHCGDLSQKTGFPQRLAVVHEALDAIAKLKTNEKLGV